MAGRWTLLMLALYLSNIVVLSDRNCPAGFVLVQRQCMDFDECVGDVDDLDYPGPCMYNSVCINTLGSFYCQCLPGFMTSTGAVNFSAVMAQGCFDIDECRVYRDICGLNAICMNTLSSYACICDDGFMSSTGVENFHQGDNVTCRDIDECEDENVCGQHAACINTAGRYQCICHAGFAPRSVQSNLTGNQERCEDTCTTDATICGNGTCHRGASGHYCACHTGFTNYGNNQSRCMALNCDEFEDTKNLQEEFLVARDLVMQLKTSCVNLTESQYPTALNGEKILERVLSAIDQLLSGETFRDNRIVSSFLDMMDKSLRLIGPLFEAPRTKKNSTQAELELLVHKGADLPKGAVNLSSDQARLDIRLETAAGDPSHYPGFTTVSLLSYKNLEDSADGFFGAMEPRENLSYKINSKVVTATVSNRNTAHLKEPVTLTLRHLKPNESSACVFWDSSVDGGSWSARSCKVLESNSEYTVCSCSRLGSFAVLTTLYDVEQVEFELQLMVRVGLSISLVCLFVCIPTFSLIRSIRSPRTTIHLHLCISLFIASVVFLAGISRTESRAGCAAVAGLLHFFLLAAFSWTCLEGIQILLLVLVSKVEFKTLFMMAGGYGVPAVIVAVSAAVKGDGYGTRRHCWLNVNLIWSFFGPAGVFITVNFLVFLVTVWKLAQKLSTLSPQTDNLLKIKAVASSAVTQLCFLGTAWIFGCYQFEKSAAVKSFLFTAFGSLQGAALFVVHCLCAKQVMDEYGNVLSRFCAPLKKKSYSQGSNEDIEESRI